MDLDRLIEALQSPSAYPHPADDFQVHQTHISVVFLAGDYAYKIKKPVSLGFIDYSSLEKRRHYCKEEVRLNRRLAPDVYLGVVPVSEVDDQLRFDTGSDGEAVEWAVRMKRLPPDRTLLDLLENDRVGEGELERLARHLTAFHRDAERNAEIAGFARFDNVAKNARDNFSQSRDQVGSIIHERVFERLSELTENALQDHRELIESRAKEQVACDTHGDLRLDHVYYLSKQDPPVIVDCIEFNPGFRFADPVSDMAFLAMDLRQAGRRDLSHTFAEAWFRAAEDEPGRELLDLYVSYRAAVRGKVQGIKAGESEIPTDEREIAARTARRHWLQALDALAPQRERPALVLVGGLPGTGKSTLARALADEAAFEVIRSDQVRKSLAGLEAGQSGSADYQAGLYTREWTERTYDACREQAERALFRGNRVIVDASFHEAARRKAFIEAGIQNGVRVVFLVCEADPDVIRERLARRRGDASDADWEIYREMAKRWESNDHAARLTDAIDTGADIETSTGQALEALRERGLH